jgi:predicted permease
VLTFELSLPLAKYPDPDRMAKLYSRVLATLKTLPGVQAAGLVHAVPMGGAPDATAIRVPGRAPKPNEQPYANYMFTSPGYFAAVRTPLLQGRDFDDSDTLNSPPVTVVNRAMAEALWPGQNAVGKQVGVGAIKYSVRTVIGIVANVKQTSLREEPAPEMYVPFTQNEIKVWPPMGTMQVAVRTMGDPAQMTTAIGKAMHLVDADLPLAKVSTLNTLVHASLGQSRFAMLLMISFGLLAMVLAAVGMYGVISHSVAQRTREIGIRLALGARRGDVQRMVLAQGGRLAAIGIAMGLAGAALGARLLASFLYGVRPADPTTFVAVPVAIAIVAILAGYLPARRAAKLDPAISLRQE